MGGSRASRRPTGGSTLRYGLFECHAVEHLDLTRLGLLPSPIELGEQLLFIERVVPLLIETEQELMSDECAFLGRQLENGAEEILGGHAEASVARTPPHG
jgi:hypothetical protein